MTMTRDYFTDRTSYETGQRCPRRRWHLSGDGPDGRGIVPARESMHLTVGKAFHAGTAHLLTYAMSHNNPHVVEDSAVAVALAEFDEVLARGGLEADFTERPDAGQELAAATGLQQTSVAAVSFEPQQDSMLSEAMDGLSDVQRQKLEMVERSGAEIFQEELEREQRAMTEALVRAWARRGLPRLLAEFEVLEVEREGQWLLHEGELPNMVDYDNRPVAVRLWFNSRHDALLVDRRTQQLVILSFKTTSAIDGRKLRDARRDMQGLSEAVDIENRLRDWWQTLQQTGAVPPLDDITPAMERYLRAATSEPRVDAVRYEWVLKGERWLDDQLTARVGFTAKRARTPLLQCWVPTGGSVMTPDDAVAMLKHSYKWTNELGETKQLYYKNFRRAQVVDLMPVGQWISLLDEGKVQPEARQPGDLARAQDVLGDVCPPPVTVYRQDDEMRDMLEQLEARERRMVENLQRVREATGEGERRSLLNVLFDQNKKACSYPGECEYTNLCFGSPEIRRDPVGSGKYRAREPNHPEHVFVLDTEPK